jgi:hypothetical protein
VTPPNIQIDPNIIGCLPLGVMRPNGRFTRRLLGSSIIKLCRWDRVSRNMAAQISRDSDLTPFQWWESRRLRYNVGMVVAGLLAFIVYITELAVFRDRIPDAEINVFMIGLQGVGYLLFMLVANGFYFLGALTERLPHMRSLASHRRLVYRLGFWFSMALPFLAPLLIAYYAVFHPGLASINQSLR